MSESTHPGPGFDDKIVDALAAQIKRLLGAIEKECGMTESKTDRLKSDLSDASKAAKTIIGRLHMITPAQKVAVVEKFGNAATTSEICEQMVGSTAPVRTLKSILEKYGTEFQRAVAKGNPPCEWRDTMKYWRENKRKYTAEIEYLREIFPDAPTGASDLPKKELREKTKILKQLVAIGYRAQLKIKCAKPKYYEYIRIKATV